MIAAAHFVGGCGSDATDATETHPTDAGHADSSAPTQFLQAEPDDLSTNHDPTNTRIGVYMANYSIPDISQSLSLRAYPGDELVAASIGFEQFSIGSTTERGYFIHPNAPLAAGWYALVMQPNGYRLVQGRARSDGAWELRFRVGSQPLLLGVAACASNDLSLFPKLLLAISEDATLIAADSPIDVTPDQQPVQCVLSELSPSGYVQMEFICSPPIPATAELQVTVRPGIIAASSGLALSTLSGELPRTFDIPVAAENQPCRFWNETASP